MFKNSFFGCLTVLCILFVNAAFSQYDQNYTPLESKGSIPDDFLRTARDLSKKDLEQVQNEEDRRAKKQFIISSNYSLRDLLLSGNVLINDPMGEYVNKVAGVLLKDEPELRKNLHIYVTRDPEVNAHAFDKGFIFINVGLLAQLENEAQLAYILAHELVHYSKKHSINSYLENLRLENGTSNYEQGSYEARNLAKYKFSKENESEADELGLTMLKQTDYSLKAVNGAFDVMQYSYLPFELVDFRKSFFEDEFLLLPDTLILKKVSEIRANDDYDDTKSSHPNIRKRRAAIEQDLEDDGRERKKFLVSESEFKSVREIARFELCNQYLLYRDYVNAIYAAYILLEKYPENLFLKKVVAISLYNITVNKSSENRSAKNQISINSQLSSKDYEVPDYNNIEGESQRLYYLLANLDAKELNTVALSYTYKAHKKYPNDKVLKMLTDSLFSELVNVNYLYPSSFSNKTKSEIKSDTVKQNRVVEKTEESKYTKIKRQQENAEVNTDDNFTKYAFVGLLKDKEFEKSFFNATHGLSRQKTDNADEPDNTSESSKSLSKRQRRKQHKKQEFLNISDVIFIDPFYIEYKIQNGTETIDFFGSEEKQLALLDLEKKCADKLGLDYTAITTKNLSKNSMETYNDNTVINDWFTERLNHGNNEDEVEGSIENIQKLMKKYGAKHLVWFGVIAKKGKHPKSKYFCLVFNMESGEVVKYEIKYSRTRYNTDIINSLVYNSLFHIVKEGK